MKHNEQSDKSINLMSVCKQLHEQMAHRGAFLISTYRSPVVLYVSVLVQQYIVQVLSAGLVHVLYVRLDGNSQLVCRHAVIDFSLVQVNEPCIVIIINIIIIITTTIITSRKYAVQ